MLGVPLHISAAIAGDSNLTVSTTLLPQLHTTAADATIGNARPHAITASLAIDADNAATVTAVTALGIVATSFDHTVDDLHCSSYSVATIEPDGAGMLLLDYSPEVASTEPHSVIATGAIGITGRVSIRDWVWMANLAYLVDNDLVAPLSNVDATLNDASPEDDHHDCHLSFHFVTKEVAWYCFASSNWCFSGLRRRPTSTLKTSWSAWLSFVPISEPDKRLVRVPRRYHAFLFDCPFYKHSLHRCDYLASIGHSSTHEPCQSCQNCRTKRIHICVSYRFQGLS